MSRFTGGLQLAGLALVLLVLAGGCGQSEAPADPTTESLVQLRAGNYDDAIRLASEAIQASPENAAAYLYRGRAYYYRAAMGDAKRAIEDLTNSIRLAPDSSDAYYTRALIYRELGQVDLADKDEHQARDLDHLAKEVFDQLPSVKNPADMVNVTPVNPKDVESAEPKVKSGAEMLRDSSATSAASTDGSKSGGGTLLGGPDAEEPVAVESEFNKQYRALLGQASPGDELTEGAAPATDAFGRPLNSPGATAPLANQGSPFSTLPGAGVAPLPSTERSGARGADSWGRSAVPPVQSPFARQTQGMGAVPGALPTTQSPFPQTTRGATGYVPPVSPFGGPGGQASGGASVSRPFSTPGTTARPQNNAVRPLYPRDYVP